MWKRPFLVFLSAAVLAYATPGVAVAAGPSDPGRSVPAAGAGPESGPSVLTPDDAGTVGEESEYARREADAGSLAEFRGGIVGLIIFVAIVVVLASCVVFVFEPHAHYYGCGHEWHGPGHHPG